MAVVAKYCEECGMKIPQEHFEDGRAISYLYLSYCENCKKKVEKLYNAFQEFASFEAAEEKKSLIYQILILVVVVVVVGAGTFFGARYFIKKSAQAQIDDIQTKFSLAQKRLDSLEPVGAENTKLKNEVAKKDNTITKLQQIADRVEQLEEDNQQLQTERNDLKVRNRELLSQAVARDNKEEDFQKTLAEKNKEITRLNKMVKDKYGNVLNKLNEENGKLRDKVREMQLSIDLLQEENKQLKEQQMGVAPRELTETRIRERIYEWAHAVNNKDAGALKKLYSAKNPFSAKPLSEIQAALESNDTLINVENIAIDPDTDTAKALLKIKYRLGPQAASRRVTMLFEREDESWRIRSEGF